MDVSRGGLSVRELMHWREDNQRVVELARVLYPNIEFEVVDDLCGSALVVLKDEGCL